MMKILFLNHPEQDYGEFFLFDGLCELFGDENIVTFPWKKSYYGIADRGYILDDGKRGSTSPCPYMKKRYVDPWSEEEIKSSLNKFAKCSHKWMNEHLLWILASPRHYDKNALRNLISLKRPDIPLAFCDHDDSLQIRKDLIE